MKLSPAITTVTGRAAPGFAVTVRRSTASPVPDAGAIDAPSVSLRAVHEHAGCARRAISACSPCAAMLDGMPPMVYRQGAACCESATWRSATVSIACRATGTEFSAMR